MYIYSMDVYRPFIQVVQRIRHFLFREHGPGTLPEHAPVLRNIRWEYVNSSDNLPDWLTNHTELIFDPTSITKENIIGSGYFSNVYAGILHYNHHSRCNVAIKIPKQLSDAETFLPEAEFMIKVDEYNNNLVNLQGIIYKTSPCTGKLTDYALLLEYCHLGQLRAYLVAHRHDFKAIDQNSLSHAYCLDGFPHIWSGNRIHHAVELLLTWSYQVANGMEFLASRSMCHGDLAARNILLTEKFVAKVSDFGHSKTDNNDHHMKAQSINTRLKQPFKWQALETLTDGLISTKSDVWSYGVLLWEMYNFGDHPWPGMGLQEVTNTLSSGIRLPLPEQWPKTLIRLIENCWLKNNDERPSFAEIKSILGKNFQCRHCRK